MSDKKDASSIAKDILSKRGKDTNLDMTFLDFSEDGKISFVTTNSIKKHIGDRSDSVLDGTLQSYSIDAYSQVVYDKGVSGTSPGKFINKLLPGKYSPKQVENFVNLLKSFVSGGHRFEMLSGKTLMEVYKKENYSGEGKGSLWTSCMTDKEYVSWYADNPQVVRVFVMYDETERILARALVWKVEGHPFSYLMDRVYYVNMKDGEKMIKYAKEQGWAHMSSFGRGSDIVYKNVVYDGKIEVVMENNPKNLYPYVDTLCYYTKSTKTLSNVYGDHDMVLQDQHGHSVESTIWSEFYDEYIDEEDAVWSEDMDSYIYASMAERMIPDDEDSSWILADEYRWSDYHNRFVREYNAVYTKQWGYLDENETVEVVVSEEGDKETYPEDLKDDRFECDDFGNCIIKGLGIMTLGEVLQLKKDVEVLCEVDYVGEEMEFWLYGDSTRKFYMTEEMVGLLNTMAGEKIITIKEYDAGYGEELYYVKQFFVFSEINPFELFEKLEKTEKTEDTDNTKYKLLENLIKSLGKLEFDKMTREGRYKYLEHRYGMNPRYVAKVYVHFENELLKDEVFDRVYFGIGTEFKDKEDVLLPKEDMRYVTRVFLRRLYTQGMNANRVVDALGQLTGENYDKVTGNHLLGMGRRFPEYDFGIVSQILLWVSMLSSYDNFEKEFNDRVKELSPLGL
jgi:hypothetical protein